MFYAKHQLLNHLFTLVKLPSISGISFIFLFCNGPRTVGSPAVVFQVRKLSQGAPLGADGQRVDCGASVHPPSLEMLSGGQCGKLACDTDQYWKLLVVFFLYFFDLIIPIEGSLGILTSDYTESCCPRSVNRRCEKERDEIAQMCNPIWHRFWFLLAIYLAIFWHSSWRIFALFVTVLAFFLAFCLAFLLAFFLAF